jgi:hypothetical protein
LWLARIIRQRPRVFWIEQTFPPREEQR